MRNFRDDDLDEFLMYAIPTLDKADLEAIKCRFREVGIDVISSGIYNNENLPN